MTGTEETRSGVAAQEREVDQRNKAECLALQSLVRDNDITLGGPLQGRIALRPKEAAPLIGVGVNRIYELCHRTDFPSIRVGNSFVIPVDALCRWLDRQTEMEVS